MADSEKPEIVYDVEADARVKLAEMKALYAKGRHDDAVTARVNELLALEPDVPPPMTTDCLVDNMAGTILDEAKKGYLTQVARARAIKLFDEWRKTAPPLDCKHEWVDQSAKDGPRQRCSKCGEGSPNRKLRSTP